MLRHALIALTKRAESFELLKDLGRLGKTLLSQRRDMKGFIAGMAEKEAMHAAETATWIGAEAIASGAPGPFDALDLPCYLAIAEIAGVKAVPAKIVLTLSEAEVSAASGSVDLSHPRMQRVREKIANTLPAPNGSAPPQEDEIDREELRERLATAMDEVPEGWMVRNARCGGSNLKALAGAGVAGPQVPEVRFGPNLEVGPGWIRTGNRRMVDTTDMRTIQAVAQGPVGGTRYLARPWLTASRWRTGEDPHRHGTPFAGKGSWPCEWRAFIRGGKVTGVSNYYGWLGEASPPEAKVALDVRALAQRMADAMAQRNLAPRFMDVEFARLNPQLAELLAPFGRDGVACTLDFIETEDGLLLLEGGPPHTPIGGGHCCAFAGTNGAPTTGNAMAVEGVAFRMLPGVILADMTTWQAGRDADRTGCILTWDEVEALASKET